MTTTPWAALPNAAVIDDILADARARPEVWAAAWNEAHTDAWRASWDETWSTIWNRVCDQSGKLAWKHTKDAVWVEVNVLLRSVVLSEVLVLSSWPESAALLDLTPDAVRTIIDTCEGDARHQAVLLLPAVIVRSTP